MTSLKGIFTQPKPPSKNFIIENRKKIRQQSGRSQCSTAVTAKPSSKCLEEQPPDGVEFPRLRKQLFVQCRNQACQTGEDISTESQICLPFSNLLTNDISHENQRKETATGLTETQVSENVTTPSENSIQEEVCVYTPSQEGSKAKSWRRPGKTRTSKKKINAPVVSNDPNCPPGHTAMSDKDRLDMLQTLSTAHEDRIQELNKLPVGTDTLRIKTRKIELEKLLNQLEEGIKLFNKPKVYVKLEE